jgi:hypothetical protein
VTRDRHDDLFDTASLEFEFDDPARASEPARRAEHSAETVELSAATLQQQQQQQQQPPERREPNKRIFLALFAGAAAIAVVAVIVVGAIRGDDSPSASDSPAAEQPSDPAEPADPAAPPADPGEPPAEAPAGSLEPVAPEDEGPAVRRLQRALASLGFDPGEVDGVYGEATVSAVAAFQGSVGLEEDGIAGPATIDALNTALERG